MAHRSDLYVHHKAARQQVIRNRAMEKIRRCRYIAYARAGVHRLFTPPFRVNPKPAEEENHARIRTLPNISSIMTARSIGCPSPARELSSSTTAVRTSRKWIM